MVLAVLNEMQCHISPAKFEDHREIHCIS